MLEKLFNLRASGTNVKTEIIAGFSTFLTMSFIIAVNPGILSDAGIDFRRVCCDHHCDSGRHIGNRPICWLACGCGAGHGAQCLFHLWCCAWIWLYMATRLNSCICILYIIPYFFHDKIARLVVAIYSECFASWHHSWHWSFPSCYWSDRCWHHCIKP